MHYLSSIYFVSHLHMFRSYVAHHQEISLYIHNSRYVLYVLAECIRADSQLKRITRTNCCICTMIPTVDVWCRLGSRSRGYHPVAPRPIAAGPLCSIVSRSVPRHATWETPISEGRNYGREMAGQFGLWFRLPRKSQGTFTCRKSATWYRRLYSLFEGTHAVDFFARKIRRLWPGSNRRSWVPEASILTTRPPNTSWWWATYARNMQRWLTK
jgi:hypothetical protein